MESPLRIMVGVILLTGLMVVPNLAAQDGVKIYISADMEGVTGVVTNEQLGPEGFEYQRF